jgi:hypothetical protein
MRRACERFETQFSAANSFADEQSKSEARSIFRFDFAPAKLGVRVAARRFGGSFFVLPLTKTFSAQTS